MCIYSIVGDNTKTMTEQIIKNKTKYWAIVGILISWVTFWIFLLSPFGLIAWIGILIYLIGKRLHLKWYIIFSAWLFVPSCNFLTGTFHYFTGTASLKSIGGPEIYHGIDRETRVTSRSSGCIFIGFEPFVFPANNAAVRLWTNVLGYQRGAYTGKYPTELEAVEIIEESDTINVRRLGNYYEFATKDISVQLDTLEFYKYRYYGVPLDKVIGKKVDDNCFLFEQLALTEIDKKIVYLVDIKNSRLLTQYFDYY